MKTEQNTISRLEASAMGMKRYYTGRECSRGHDSPRYVSTGQCIECQKATQRVYQSRILRRDLKVYIPVPKELMFSKEDELHAAVLKYGTELAQQMAAEFPMRPYDRINTELQQNLAGYPDHAQHPGGFRGPRVRNPDKAYLSVQTVHYADSPGHMTRTPSIKELTAYENDHIAPPPPPTPAQLADEARRAAHIAAGRIAAPQCAVAPPPPPMPPVATVRPPEPTDVGYVDDIEPTVDELLAEFERMSR